MIPNLSTQQRRRHADARLQGVPDAAGRDHHRRRRSAAGGLPPHRHRCRILATSAAWARRSDAPASRARRGLHRDQDLDQRLRLRRDAARVREGLEKARRRADRPVDPAPAAAFGFRPHHRSISRARAPAGRRQGSGDRHQQFHAAPSGAAAGRGRYRAGGQPDRAAPYLPAARAAAPAREARHPDPGLGPNWRHYLLPARLRQEHARRTPRSGRLPNATASPRRR